MQQFGDSIKESSKSESEDLYLHYPTKHGDLFVVLDFAGHNYRNFNLKLKSDFSTLIDQLSVLRGINRELFLGCLAKELNNYVLRMGQEFCAGRLFCVVAMGLLNANNFTYLTYGDARINIFDGDRLILLNGSRYQTRMIVADIQERPKAIDESPEQFGRRFFDIPLVDRVHTVTLGDSDTVLMFSDGVEAILSPPYLLRELRGLITAGPQEIYDAIMLATSSVQDDRTLVVIKGTFGKLPSAAEEQIREQVSALKTNLEQQIKTETESSWENFLQSATKILETQISGVNGQVREIRDLCETKTDAEMLRAEAEHRQQLESRIEQLESVKTKKGGKVAPTIKEDELKRMISDVVSNDPAWWSTLAPAPPDNGPKDAESSNRTPAMIPVGYDDRDGYEVRNDHQVHGFAWKIITTLIVFGLGFMFAWVLGYWGFLRSGSAARESWQVKAAENVLTLIHNDGSGFDRVDLLLATSVRNDVPREHAASSFREVGEFLTRIGVSQRGSDLSNRDLDSDAARAKPSPTLEVTAMPGDSLEKIAKRYNVTREKLNELNPGFNWGTLKAGQKIKVPDSSGNAESK